MVMITAGIEDKSWVGGRPCFHLNDLREPGERLRGDFFPMTHERCHEFFSCRYALAGGISALGLRETDVVLLPSYNCGVEIDPFINAGLSVQFYRVREDLLVDLEDIERRITPSVKAVLITHYLGFPQPIAEVRDLCRKKGIFVIEDCAHSLLSGLGDEPLGSYGDIAVFSLLKTLPVPNGGILVLNSDAANMNRKPGAPSTWSTLLYASDLIKYRTNGVKISGSAKLLRVFGDMVYSGLRGVKLALVVRKKILREKGLYLVRADSNEFTEDVVEWGMSGLSKRILHSIDYHEIKERRRRNFLQLLKYFANTFREVIMIKELPDGVSPLFFPLLLADKTKRDKLYGILLSRGVVTHPWWKRFHYSVPWEMFPDAVHLKERLLGLPVHQDLTIDHMDYVIAEFRKAYALVN